MVPGGAAKYDNSDVSKLRPNLQGYLTRAHAGLQSPPASTLSFRQLRRFRSKSLRVPTLLALPQACSNESCSQFAKPNPEAPRHSQFGGPAQYFWTYY